MNDVCVSRVIPGTPSQVATALTGLAARRWGSASPHGTFALRLEQVAGAVGVEMRVGRRAMPTQLEVLPWSSTAVHLLLRPVRSKRRPHSPALTDRYFHVAHLAMSDLAFDVERLLLTPVGAPAQPRP